MPERLNYVPLFNGTSIDVHCVYQFMSAKFVVNIFAVGFDRKITQMQFFSTFAAGLSFAKHFE